MTGMDGVLHPTGLVSLVRADPSGARRAGMRATEHAVTVPTFFVSRTLELEPTITRAKQQGATVSEILVIAAAVALRAYPAANACLYEGNVYRYSTTRVGILVRAGDALLPLVFPDAEGTTALAVRNDRLSLHEMLQAGRLPADRMSTPTFVISNLGRSGVDWFTAVLFPGTAMTLAIGRTESVGSSTRVRAVVTCDHRLVDGVDGAEFLEAMEQAIQSVQIPD